MVSKTKPLPPTPEACMSPRSLRRSLSPSKKSNQQQERKEAISVLEQPTLDVVKPKEDVIVEPEEDDSPKDADEEVPTDESRDEKPIEEAEALDVEGEKVMAVEEGDTDKESSEVEADDSAPVDASTDVQLDDVDAEKTNDDDEADLEDEAVQAAVEMPVKADNDDVAEEIAETKEEDVADKEDVEDTPAVEEDEKVMDEEANEEEATPVEEDKDGEEANDSEDEEEGATTEAEPTEENKKVYELPPDFLAGAPRLTSRDVDADLDEDEVGIIEEFEDAWKKFLQENSPKLLSDTQEAHTLGLMREIDEIEAGKAQVKKELEEQLNFFGTGKQRVEEKYKGLLADATKQQREAHNEIQVHLDNAALADVHMTQAIPWENFLESLNHAVIMAQNESNPDESAIDSPKSTGKKTVASKAIKPSDRARFLIDTSNKDECEQSVELRAYRIDNALLNAHIKTLQNELERYEKSADSMELIGKFLTEHNVWDILTKK